MPRVCFRFQVNRGCHRKLQFPVLFSILGFTTIEAVNTPAASIFLTKNMQFLTWLFWLTTNWQATFLKLKNVENHYQSEFSLSFPFSMDNGTWLMFAPHMKGKASPGGLEKNELTPFTGKQNYAACTVLRYLLTGSGPHLGTDG